MLAGWWRRVGSTFSPTTSCMFLPTLLIYSMFAELDGLQIGSLVHHLAAQGVYFVPMLSGARADRRSAIAWRSREFATPPAAIVSPSSNRSSVGLRGAALGHRFDPVVASRDCGVPGHRPGDMPLSALGPQESNSCTTSSPTPLWWSLKRLTGCGMQRSSYSAMTISPASSPQAGHFGIATDLEGPELLLQRVVRQQDGRRAAPQVE